MQRAGAVWATKTVGVAVMIFLGPVAIAAVVAAVRYLLKKLSDKCASSDKVRVMSRRN